MLSFNGLLPLKFIHSKLTISTSPTLWIYKSVRNLE